MSEESLQVVRGVRTPVTVPSEARRRSLDERIFVRFPRLRQSLASFWSRLPPRSRLRRAMTSRIVRRGAAAANRRDFDVLFLNLDPEIEFRFTGAFAPPDLLGWQHGHEGYRRIWAEGVRAWSDLRLEVQEVIDFGDRIVASGRQIGTGTASGIPTSERVFWVFTLRRGLVIRQEVFTHRAEALEATGLSE